MLELVALITMGIVALGALFTLHSLSKQLLQANRSVESDLLDRVQSPEAEGYARRKWNEQKLAEMAAESAEPAVQPNENSVLSRRPWMNDPNYANCDVVVDHANGEVQIINEEQDLVTVPLHDFLARYTN